MSANNSKKEDGDNDSGVEGGSGQGQAIKAAAPKLNTHSEQTNKPHTDHNATKAQASPGAKNTSNSRLSGNDSGVKGTNAKGNSTKTGTEGTKTSSSSINKDSGGKSQKSGGQSAPTHKVTWAQES